MKTFIKKMNMALLIAVVMLSSLLLSGLLLLWRTHGALAADTNSDPSVTFSTDVEEVIAGGSFTLTTKIEVPASRTDLLSWYAVSLCVGVTDGMTNEDDYALNTNIAKYLSAEKNDDFTAATVNDDFKNYVNMSVDFFSQTTLTPLALNGALQLSLSFGGTELISSSNSLTFISKIKVADTIISEGGSYLSDAPTGGKQFTLGIKAVPAINKIEFTDSSNGTVSCAPPNLVYNSVTLRVRKADSDARLSDLKVGHGSSNTSLKGDAEELAENLEYVSNSADLTNFVAKPIQNGVNAVIKFRLNDDTTQIDAKSGEDSTFTLKAGENKLYVDVTSEDGKNTKTYTLTIYMGYVRLSDLGIVVTSEVAKNWSDDWGDCINGVEETFDKDTQTYHVNVFSDYSEIKLTPTVLTGYDASNDVTLTCTDCDAKDDSDNAITKVTSGGDAFITLTLAEDAETTSVKLTVTASNNDTYDYTIIFKSISVKAELKEIKVTGVDSGTDFDYDTTKFNNGDGYYFLMAGETSGSSKVSMTPCDGASLQFGAVPQDGSAVTYADFVNGTAYEKGEYSIAIKAEAGNIAFVALVLNESLWLRVKDDSEYQFLTMRDGDDGYVYRRAYAEIGWVHGEDDVENGKVKDEVEEFVLGQIRGSTTISVFLTNFPDDVLSMLTLYAVIEGVTYLLYDCGTRPSDIDEADYDDPIAYSVSTGWYVTYGTGASEYTVYLSVLGDANGDGSLSALDAGTINAYIKSSEKAAMHDVLSYAVINSGSISSLDVGALSAVIKGSKEITEYYYLPAATASTASVSSLTVSSSSVSSSKADEADEQSVICTADVPADIITGDPDEEPSDCEEFVEIV